jgi:colanic acid/amylovoran biosynthesis glycosyltransferase
MVHMQVAYFVNQYPAVSHTFIRREIQALELLGMTVLRFALRPGSNLVDDEDKAELKRTQFVLKIGVLDAFRSVVALLKRPKLTVSVICSAFVSGWRSDRGIFRQLAYVAEGAILATLCQRAKAQHIHAHFGTNSAAIAMFASQLSGIPFSFTVHGPEEFEKGSLLSLDMKLEKAKFAACISAFGRSQLMRLTSPDQWQKIAIVHCGLDDALLNAPTCEIPPAPRFVCVGRLAPEKGHLVLISAAKKLREAGVNFEIIFAGDGPMRQRLEEAIRRAGAQVKILGWVPNDRVRAEIEAARALILPSFSEGLPVAIMEAMALCRPVISTYVAGIPELVQPGKTGWLVPAGDDDALAGAMKEALAAPAAELAAMGERGRTLVLERHDVSKESEKLKIMIEHAVSENGRQPTK